MPVDRYNDMGSPDGAVARTGSQGGSQPAGARPRATGTPAIQQAEGTDSPRVTVSTLQAPLPSTPSGGKSSIPKAVTSYPDGV